MYGFIPYAQPSLTDSTKTYREVAGDMFAEDVEAAQALMAEAGYPNGEGFPTVEIVIQNDTTQSLMAQILGEFWKQNLGVEYTIQPYESSVYWSELDAGNFSIDRNGYTVDYVDPSANLRIFITGANAYENGWDDETYDQMYNDIPPADRRRRARSRDHRAGESTSSTRCPPSRSTPTRTSISSSRASRASSATRSDTTTSNTRRSPNDALRGGGASLPRRFACGAAPPGGVSLRQGRSAVMRSGLLQSSPRARGQAPLRTQKTAPQLCEAASFNHPPHSSIAAGEGEEADRRRVGLPKRPPTGKPSPTQKTAPPLCEAASFNHPPRSSVAAREGEEADRQRASLPKRLRAGKPSPRKRPLRSYAKRPLSTIPRIHPSLRAKARKLTELAPASRSACAQARAVSPVV